MITNKIPFTLDAWLKDKTQRVVEYDGSDEEADVEIVFYDKNRNLVVALAPGGIYPFSYDCDGRDLYSEGNQLYLVSELSEEKLARTLKSWLCNISHYYLDESESETYKSIINWIKWLDSLTFNSIAYEKKQTD